MVLIIAILCGGYAIASLIIIGAIAQSAKARRAHDKKAFYALGLTDTDGSIEA